LLGAVVSSRPGDGGDCDREGGKAKANRENHDYWDIWIAAHERNPKCNPAWQKTGIT